MTDSTKENINYNQHSINAVITSRIIFVTHFAATTQFLGTFSIKVCLHVFLNVNIVVYKVIIQRKGRPQTVISINSWKLCLFLLQNMNRSEFTEGRRTVFTIRSDEGLALETPAFHISRWQFDLYQLF